MIFNFKTIAKGLLGLTGIGIITSTIVGFILANKVTSNKTKPVNTLDIEQKGFDNSVYSINQAGLKWIIENHFPINSKKSILFDKTKKPSRITQLSPSDFEIIEFRHAPNIKMNVVTNSWKHTDSTGELEFKVKLTNKKDTTKTRILDVKYPPSYFNTPNKDIMRNLINDNSNIKSVLDANIKTGSNVDDIIIENTLTIPSTFSYDKGKFKELKLSINNKRINKVKGELFIGFQAEWKDAINNKYSIVTKIFKPKKTNEFYNSAKLDIGYKTPTHKALKIWIDANIDTILNENDIELESSKLKTQTKPRKNLKIPSSVTTVPIIIGVKVKVGFWKITPINGKKKLEISLIAIYKKQDSHEYISYSSKKIIKET